MLPVITDNFLEQSVFEDMQNIFMRGDLPWWYRDFTVDYPEEGDYDFQFVHMLYLPENFYQTSDELFDKICKPVIEKISPMSIYRIKANLTTRAPENMGSDFHIDIDNLKNNPEKLKQWTTAIFYINTNNGYTEFEDGTRVESVANRIVNFPANLKHRGTRCTDQKIRIVINFNYFK